MDGKLIGMLKSYKTTMTAVFMLFLVNLAWAQNQQEYVLKINVFDQDSRLPLQDAQIAITPCSCGGVTQKDGQFSMLLPTGQYKVTISYLGYRGELLQVDLSDDRLFRVSLEEEQEQLSEVVLTARNTYERIERPQMGVVQLDTKELKKIPAALGEFDVLRGITLLAGINNAGEISNGLSIRGGSLDQNLILYDNAPIFNPTHLFGLFSVFTPDMVSEVDLYRANIPARYGGRIASVLDVKVKNPYVDKTKISGGIGLVSSRLSIETPLIKEKLLLSSGVRAGFTDFLFPLVSEELKNTKARFYDGTMKLLWLPKPNDQVYFTGFFSKDFYQIDLISKVENVNAENNQYDFLTLNGTLGWLHAFDNGADLKTSLVHSDYKPKTIFPEVGNDNEIVFESNIRYTSLMAEYSKVATDNFEYYGGIQANRYKIFPGELDPGTGNNINALSLEPENSYELSAFANTEFKPWNDLSISLGTRFTHFLFNGPYTQAIYDETGVEQIAFSEFEKGENVKTYNGLEPRLGLSYTLDENTSIKASYARIYQYLQNVYNTTTPLPTSRWKTSDPYIQPQESDNYGLGLYKNFDDGNIEIAVEGYYRDTRNNLTYKPGADFFLEEFLEQDVVQGQGKAYGVELSLNKPLGAFNGWFNYTWSRSFMRSQNELLSDRINNNEWYPSDFDRPHVFNATMNYEGEKFHVWGFNFTYQTGRPYTAPNSIFTIDDIDVPLFIERNNARLRPYHRLDFSWKIKPSNNLNRRWIGDWTFTVYNLYSRKNPFNLYYAQRQDNVDSDVFLASPLGTYELALMNSPLFSLTYNFVFK